MSGNVFSGCPLTQITTMTLKNKLMSACLISSNGQASLNQPESRPRHIYSLCFMATPASGLLGGCTDSVLLLKELILSFMMEMSWNKAYNNNSYCCHCCSRILNIYVSGIMLDAFDSLSLTLKTNLEMEIIIHIS